MLPWRNIRKKRDPARGLYRNGCYAKQTNVNNLAVTQSAANNSNHLFIINYQQQPSFSHGRHWQWGLWAIPSANNHSVNYHTISSHITCNGLCCFQKSSSWTWKQMYHINPLLPPACLPNTHTHTHTQTHTAWSEQNAKVISKHISPPTLSLYHIPHTHPSF